jgi:GDP-4-dehydro-6-deoxy-D-mannose reductase
VNGILITGGTGFVGPYLAELLRAHAPEITIVATDLARGRRLPGIRYEYVDIRRAEQVQTVIHDLQPSEIYHLAGLSSVDLCRRDPRLALEVNVLGTYNVIEAGMSLPCPARILNVSTSQVYAPSEMPLSEISRIGPSNAYAATKAMAELISVQWRGSCQGGVITVRAFNHAGAGQSEDFVISSIAKQFAQMLGGLKEPTLELGNTNVSRDFTNVRDVVRAYAGVLRQGRVGEVYNVCSGTSVQLLTVVRTFEMISGIRVEVHASPARTRASDISQVTGDPSKICAEIDWVPQIPFEETARELLEFWTQRTVRAQSISV